MKTWKLVSGILSIVFFLVVSLQSCAAGAVNAIEENEEDTSAGGGMILGILMLAAGIVSIATRKSGKGGNIATCIIFALAALAGYANLGTYGDLAVWATWCAICALFALIAIIKSPKPAAET
ncbi:MAG: hypothetical protein II167_05770 [Clostridiales bacterium]|nr:hypothetical protein [Clostridiales bacterium]